MPVDIDIAHVARLARLDLGPEELQSYKDQLGVILEHAARVQTLEGEPHAGSAHPLRLTNVYREDEVQPSLDRDEVLAEAPESIDGYFAVPPVMESA
jgi:aspartyl-tRNA(Asn)/glutamyl-tRNA(Gln) amidotransferase subunit C